MKKGKNLTFPDSVVAYFKGMMGQPMGGFPKRLQELVLKGEKPLDKRPGEFLPDVDFDKIRKYLMEKYKRDFSNKEVISYALYPDVYEDYLKYLKEHGDFSCMGSDIFFHGLREGETCEIDIAEGKTLIIQLLEIGKVDSQGYRYVVFEVDGNRRDVRIKDRASLENVHSYDDDIIMADSESENEIGASIPGNIVKILVNPGDEIKKGESLLVIEAMKMETNITASKDGIIDEIFVKEKQQVKPGQLLIKLK
jgi:pyruvate carboxylase